MITSSRAMHFLFVRHPMNSFRDLFFAALDKALETGRRVDVQAAEDGLQHMHFTCEDPLMSGGPKWTCTGTVDPSKGFAIPQWEFTLPSGNRSRFSATFTEISAGVWFPTEGRIEGFFADGMPNGRTSVKVANLIVNDPNMDAGVFHIHLREGTHVTNRIAGIAYIVGDPSSTRVLGDPMSTDHVVNDAVKKDDPAERLRPSPAHPEGDCEGRRVSFSTSEPERCSASTRHQIVRRWLIPCETPASGICSGMAASWLLEKRG